MPNHFLRPRLTRRLPARCPALLGSVLGAALVTATPGCGAVRASSSPQARAGQVTASAPGLVAPSRTPATCDDLTTADDHVNGPAVPVHHLSAATAGLNYYVGRSGIYVDDGSEVAHYSLSGGRLGSFSLPAAFSGPGSGGISGPLVDGSGDIWLASSSDGEIAKFSPSGSALWQANDFSHPQIYGLVLQGQYRVALTTAGGRSTDLLGPSGAVVGRLPLVLSGFVSQAPNGDILDANGGYVSTYSQSGRLLGRFGSAEDATSPTYVGQPYHFFYQGSALEPVAHGPIYTIDPLGTLEQTSEDGILQATTDLGGAFQTSQVGQAYIVAGQLFFVTGTPFGSDYQVSSVPFSQVKAYLRLAASKAGSLGWGAGVTAGSPGHRQAGNYFPYGSTPRFYASFDPWWEKAPGHFTLSYAVWDDAALRSGPRPAVHSTPLPLGAGPLADVPLQLPSADRAPGPYQLRATLVQNKGGASRPVGSVCIAYSVGPPGAALALAGLPPGGGFGGPSDQRGVVLNHQLGLDGLRGAAIDWSVFLPSCTASSPSLGTCGPSALQFGSAPSSYFQAAYLAKKYDVTYWVQVSTGDPISQALVNGGWWGADVARVVSYYSHVANCHGRLCAPVTDWEAWNEANNTYSADGAAFTSEVLRPFYEAVKSAAPKDLVIGGSSLGVALSWWQQVVQAGGLSYMDVAGVHPYTGYNDSWEEDGTIGQLRRLQQALNGTPVWFTEVGWWSDGPYNFLNQADIVARAMVWQKVLDVPVWGYYFDEGGWGNDGVSFSLVQYETTDNYVKPAALATMEAAAQLGGRTYRDLPTTGIPHTYRADFGPSARKHNQLSVLWTDGLTTTAQLAVMGRPGKVTITNQWGEALTYDLSPGRYYAIKLSDQVTYVQYPATSSLSVQPVQAFGPDLALSATPSASSSADGSSPRQALEPAAQDAGWSPSAADPRPDFTVTLPHRQSVNRVVLDMHSIGSVEGDARDFTLSVPLPSGGWRTIAKVTGVFYDHTVEVSFAPITTTAVRLTIDEANYGSSYGGAVPPWWPRRSPVHIQLHSFEIYGPGQSGTPQPLPGGPPPV